MVAASLVAGSENAAAHCLGLSHSTVKHHLANAPAMGAPPPSASGRTNCAPLTPNSCPTLASLPTTCTRRMPTSTSTLGPWLLTCPDKVRLPRELLGSAPSPPWPRSS